jgi:hypothetical protein
MNHKKAVTSLIIVSLFIFPMLAYAHLVNHIYLPVVLNHPLKTGGPTTSPVPSATPSETPPAGEVFIRSNTTHFQEEGEDLYVFGEVQNDSEDHLKYVKVTVNLLGSAGEMIDTDTAYVYLDNLESGDKSCFRIKFSDPPAWSSFEFEKLSFSTSGGPLPNLAIYDHEGSYELDFDHYSVTGNVRNDQGNPLSDLIVVSTLYNNQDEVVSCDFTHSFSQLDPGESYAFEVLHIYGDLSTVDSYRVQADGSP